MNYLLAIVLGAFKGENKMGLDITIWKARNHQIFKEPKWYESNEVEEVYYARKFWTLIQEASFLRVNEDYGEYIQLSRDNVEELLQIAAHNRDYFNGFSTVPALCKILDEFDDMEEAGYHYYMEFDY